MSVLSLQVALVVVGGVTSTRPCTTSVDIFKLDTLQWYRTDPLPMECCNLSMVSTDNTCYALGGYKYPIQLNQALYSSIDDLLHHAVLHNKTPHDCRGDSDSQSAWKTLPNIPSYRPTAAIVAGNLLAIGGNAACEGRAYKSEVYMYSVSSNSWIYISDLPLALSKASVAVLSSVELLVIGGRGDVGRMNAVCMGILTLR